MRRSILLVSVALLMMALLIAIATPASAQPIEQTLPAAAAKGFSTASIPSKAIEPVGDEEFGAEENGEPGKFSFQLILDNGAEEYAIRPPAEDADALMDLF